MQTGVREDAAASSGPGADVPGADVTGADVQGADVHGADVQGADVRRADVRDAEVAGPGAASDGALARRAALGDRQAFAEIFERHAEAMFRYAVHMLGGDHADAEDAVQAALVKAWQKLPQFRGEAALRTWLFRITANEVHAHRRRARPTPVDDKLLHERPEARTSDPARVLLDAELWDVLAVALSELPWRQRASWVLRELEEFSYDDIAVVLDTTPTVVRGQLHRARRSVAVRMEQWR